MKIAICADLHAHNYTQYATLSEDGTNSRLRWVLDAFKEIVRISVEQRVDALVIAGDVFHSRKAIDITVLDAVYQEFARVKNLPMFLVAGNHDIYEGGGRFSVRVFSKTMKVIRKPSVIEIAGTKIGVVPWLSSDDKVAGALKVFRDDKIKYVIGHVALKGGVVGVQNYAMEEGIEPSVFRGFKWVALGHYHKQQKLGNCCYVGSPLQHTWGESGDKKGFMIFDDDGGRFVELKGFPRFIKIANGVVPDDIQDFDYVKLTGKKSDVQKVVLPAGVKRVEVFERDAVVQPRVVFTDETYQGILQKYVQTNEQDTVDNKFLVQVGLTYMKGE